MWVCSHTRILRKISQIRHVSKTHILPHKRIILRPLIFPMFALDICGCILRNMKQSKTIWVIGALIVILLIVGIVANSRKSPSGPTTIKVGIIAPLTGQYGFLGESFQNAVKLAAGDDPRIQLIFEDDKFDGKSGLSAFQKLTSIDHVDIIINESSPTLETITPVVSQTHIPVIQIFESKEHNRDSIFQMMPFSYPLFSDLGKIAEARYKRIALVYSSATDVLVTDADYFKRGLTSQSTIVSETKVVDTNDMRTQVTKILASNPDAVTNIFVLNDGIKFIKELNVQKGNKKIALICDANTEFVIGDYIKALGTSTFEGCLSTNLPDLTTQTFKQEYSERFQANPVIGADWGYDAIAIVKSLIGVPKDQWIEKIGSVSFAGASGHVSFDENGTRLAAVERHIFKDGKFVKFE